MTAFDFDEIVERRGAVGLCTCDFCVGKKRWEDNWCPRCGDVRMKPPKFWENMDICDACDRIVLEQDEEEEEQQ